MSKLELQVVATDVEKNPRETQVFKTRVPPFTFLRPVLLHFFLFSPPARASSSSSPVLLSSIPYFFFPYSTSLDLHSPERSSDLLLLPSFLVLHLHCHLRSSSSLELKSLRLKFHVTKSSPC